MVNFLWPHILDRFVFFFISFTQFWLTFMYETFMTCLFILLFYDALNFKPI